MALIQCPECSTKVSDKAVSCPSCGCPIAAQNKDSLGYPISSLSNDTATQTTTLSISKSRGVHIILGLIFGVMGFHNFYSGHNLRGAIKLCILFVTFVLDASTGFRTGFSLVALVVIAFWSIIEVIVVKNDASGKAMT